jgi:hypothetical protein
MAITGARLPAEGACAEVAEPGVFLSDRTSQALALAIIRAPVKIAPHKIATWLFFIGSHPEWQLDRARRNSLGSFEKQTVTGSSLGEYGKVL